jgi:hypothetical protein
MRWREMQIRHRVLAALFAMGVLVCISIDWYDRSSMGISFQAPTQTLLLVSIAFACLIGAIGQLTLWLIPSRLTDFIIKTRRLPVRQRYCWSNLKQKVLMDLLCGSWGILIIPFAVWCVFNQVVFVAALLAMFTILLSNIPQWVTMHLEPIGDDLSHKDM